MKEEKTGQIWLVVDHSASWGKARTFAEAFRNMLKQQSSVYNSNKMTIYRFNTDDFEKIVVSDFGVEWPDNITLYKKENVVIPKEAKTSMEMWIGMLDEFVNDGNFYQILGEDAEIGMTE